MKQSNESLLVAKFRGVGKRVRSARCDVRIFDHDEFRAQPEGRKYHRRRSARARRGRPVGLDRYGGLYHGRLHPDGIFGTQSQVEVRAVGGNSRATRCATAVVQNIGLVGTPVLASTDLRSQCAFWRASAKRIAATRESKTDDNGAKPPAPLTNRRHLSGLLAFIARRPSARRRAVQCSSAPIARQKP